MFDQDCFENPFIAMSELGGAFATQGVSPEELVAIAEQTSCKVSSERDVRNLRGYAEEFIHNPDFIRVTPPDRLRDIDNRAADRVTIQKALGQLSTTQAESQGEQ